MNLCTNSSVEDKLKWAFTLFDIDNDGTISKEEMSTVLRSVYSLIKHCSVYSEELTAASVAKRVEDVFAMCDENHNGHITKEEFITHALEDSLVLASLSLYNRSMFARTKTASKLSLNDEENNVSQQWLTLCTKKLLCS